MPMRATEEEIQAFLDEHQDLMRDLSDSLVCPCCGEMVRGDKVNLGEKYNWAEGCKGCSHVTQG